VKRIETNLKKRGVSTPLSPRTERYEIRLEKLNLSHDFQDVDSKKWLEKSFLERQIEHIVWKWRLGNKKFKRDFKELFSPTKVPGHIDTLEKAHILLVRLADWLRDDERVPVIRVEDQSKQEIAILSATDYLAQGGLKWVANWLAEINLKKGGRTPDPMIANCAEELAQLFKKHTGLSRWKMVGEIVAAAFPEKLSIDDGRRDIRLWIKNLVKRNQLRQKRIQSQKLKFGVVNAKSNE
jgi:hypothetical protein